MGRAKPNNQSVLIKGNKTDSAANPIRKSELIKEPTSLAKVINEHEDWLFENVQDEEIKIPYKYVQDQCFVAATRSRSKEASEKVPDIFPLQGEHRKPEHAHRPRKGKTLNQPMNTQPRNETTPVVPPTTSNSSRS